MPKTSNQRSLEEIVYLTEYQANLIKIVGENEPFIPTDKYVLRGLNGLLDSGLVFQPEKCVWALTEIGRVWLKEPHVCEWKRKSSVKNNTEDLKGIYCFRDALREFLGLQPIAEE